LVVGGVVHARESNSGEVLVGCDGEEDEDGVRTTMGISGAWSTRPAASWNCDEGRPEKLRATVGFGFVESLHKTVGRQVHWMRKIKNTGIGEG
jgi:hypothetical protein